MEGTWVAVSGGWRRPSSPQITLTLIVLLLVTVKDILSSCSSALNSSCTCINSEFDDEETKLINCTSVGLTTFPLDLPDYPNMKLEWNHIPVLEWVPYPELIKLSMMYNGMRFIKDYSFSNSSKLKELTLSNNRISGLSSNTFSGLLNLHTLYLRNNSLYEIENFTFSGSNMPHLNILVLANSKLIRIAPKAFEGATSLHLLDLSANSLTSPIEYFGHLELNTLNISSNNLHSLVDSPFQYLKQLQKLFVAHNQIVNITSKDLNGLSSLIQLSLDHNDISLVHRYAFQHTKMLQDLDLSHNRLKALDSDCIPWFSIEKLHLGSNPWYCGCQTHWLHEQEIVMRWNLGADLICSEPKNVVGKHVFSVSDHVFDCPHGHNITIGVIIGIVAGIVLAIVGSVLLYKLVVKKKLSAGNARGSRGNGVSVTTTSSYSRVQDSRELFDSCVESNVT